MRHSSTEELRTHRLVLTPLDPGDAPEMMSVLTSRRLYEYTGGEPPDIDQLERRFRAQVGGPPDGNEQWHNWIVRLAVTGAAVGTVQATVTDEAANIAWVIGVDHQGLGFATEAARAMCEWLAAEDVHRLVAHIHPHHEASKRVAAKLGLASSGEIDDDGEIIWISGRG